MTPAPPTTAQGLHRISAAQAFYVACCCCIIWQSLNQKHLPSKAALGTMSLCKASTYHVHLAMEQRIDCQHGHRKPCHTTKDERGDKKKESEHRTPPGLLYIPEGPAIQHRPNSSITPPTPGRTTPIDAFQMLLTGRQP